MTLGALPSVQSSLLGFNVDCASPLQYYTSPLCWWQTLDDWQAGNLQATRAAVAAAGPIPTMKPAGPSTLVQETVPGTWSPDQAITAGDAAYTQALSDYFGGVQQNLSDLAGNPPKPDYTWVWLVGAGIVALLLVRR